MGTQPGVGLNGSAILGMFPFPLPGLFLEAEWVPKGPGYGVDKGADDISALMLQPQKPRRKEGRLGNSSAPCRSLQAPGPCWRQWGRGAASFPQQCHPIGYPHSSAIHGALSAGTPHGD